MQLLRGTCSSRAVRGRLVTKGLDPREPGRDAVSNICRQRNEGGTGRAKARG